MIVCSGGVVGWYGADVTPWIFYENFIDVMVNIDSNDGPSDLPIAGVMVRSTGGNGAVDGGFYTE
jgi:hypothetical protein